MRDRVTITVRQDLLEKVDAMLDETLDNRSQAIESILDNHFRSQSAETAVLLAGGLGTRLRPLTYEIPKGMVQVKGKPILHHQLDLFTAYGITHIVMVVGYLGDQIKSYFGDGSRFGVHIDYVDVDIDTTGTAGAIRKTQPFISGRFIVQNADTLMNPPLTDIVQHHIHERRLMTMLLATTEDPTSSGIVHLQGNRIVGFTEKPENPSTNIINGGLYVCEPSIFNWLPDDQENVEMLFPHLAEENQLTGYVTQQPIYDVGTVERYERAIREWEPQW